MKLPRIRHSWFGRRTKHVVPALHVFGGNDLPADLAPALAAFKAALNPGEPLVVTFNAPDRPLWGGDDKRVRSVADVRGRVTSVAHDLAAAGCDLVVPDCEYDRTAERDAAVHAAIERPLSEAGLAWTQWAHYPRTTDAAAKILSEWSGQPTAANTTSQPVNDPPLYCNPMAAGQVIDTPIELLIWETDKVKACLGAQPNVPCVPCVASLLCAAPWVTRELQRELFRLLAPLTDLSVLIFDQTGEPTDPRKRDFDEGVAVCEDYDTVSDEWQALTRGVPVKQVMEPGRVHDLDAYCVWTSCQLADGRMVGSFASRSKLDKPLVVPDGRGGQGRIVFDCVGQRYGWGRWVPNWSRV